MTAHVEELGLADVQAAVEYVRTWGREISHVVISKRLFDRIVDEVGMDITDHDWTDPTVLRIAHETLLVVDGPREHIEVKFI